MMTTSNIPAFNVKGTFIQFNGGVRFSAEGHSLILNPENGTSIILTDEMADSIVDKTMSEPLVIKLVQRGLATMPGGLVCQ